MSKDVILPSSFTIDALYPFVQSIVLPSGYPSSDSFTFDFRWLRFIDGGGLTVFSNTMAWLGKLGVKTFFRSHAENRSEAILYLDRCGFFERYLGAKINPYATQRSTSIPCTEVSLSDSFEWLEYKFTPWMASTLAVDPRALYSLRTCVKEIFANIRDHSTEEIGCIHLQTYPRVNKVNITVSDFGRGIPDTIREKFGPMSDMDAILKASVEGVTAQSIPQNRGMGLHYLCETVASNFGQVSIYSFGGALVCGKDASGTTIRTHWAGTGSYPGTLVHIVLSTDKFVGDEVAQENLEW